jgi:hypothetical protein
MEKSPVIKLKPEEFSFPVAIHHLIEGKRIARTSWGDAPDYGVLKDGYLMIFRQDKFFQWILNDGDLQGEDWQVLPNIN